MTDKSLNILNARWTKVEEDRMVNLKECGYSTEDIADTLNNEFGTYRTNGAVVQKLIKLGLPSSDNRRHRRWAWVKAEDNKLKNLWFGHLSMSGVRDEITKVKGNERSINAILTRAYRLGLKECDRPASSKDSGAPVDLPPATCGTMPLAPHLRDITPNCAMVKINGAWVKFSEGGEGVPVVAVEVNKSGGVEVSATFAGGGKATVTMGD